MKKQIHMIGNTHFDPVWLWRWDEALASIRATLRSALERMKEDEDFVYSFSAPAVFRMIEETEPEMMEEIKARGAMTIVICDEEADIDADAVDYMIRIPKINETLMPMVATVPMQLLAYYTSVNKGNDVDKPRNLAKSVTVE